MQHVTSRDGTLIGFACSGSGAPLLLVHGTTADHRRWAHISPLLEQRFTVYAMDRRGRGASGEAAEYHTLREAEDVAAVVEAIGGPVFLLGHSYGAVCSLEAALLTGKVRRLILYEPPIPTGMPMGPPDIAGRIQALVDRGELEAALVLFLREVVQMPEQELEAYRQLPMWQGRIQLAPTLPRELAFDKTYTFEAEKFAELQVPTAFLLGSDSPPFFQRVSEVVAAALPDCQVVLLPGQQHIAMDTNPELFVREVENFLLA